MEELIEHIGSYNKEIIKYIILRLMENGKIDFADITQAHVEHLEQLRKGQSEKLLCLRSELICMWSDSKKNVGKNIRRLMQQAKDEGWANISQEQIDKSKWK